MIRSATGIFLDSPAEFAEDERHNAVELRMDLQVFREGRERTAELFQEPGMSRRLIGVRIKSVEGHVIDPRGQSSVDELRDLLQLGGQRSGRVGDWRLVGVARLRSGG